MLVALATLTPEFFLVKFEIWDDQLRKLTRWGLLWRVMLRVEHDALSTFYVAVRAMLGGGP